MTTRMVNLSLQTLLDYLNNLTQRATIEDLQSKILALDITADEVWEYARFGDDRYLRNLMCAGDYYHALILCWRSGQRSPIHNHAHSTCGLRVLQGIATETAFESTPCGQVKAVSSFDRHAGQVSVSQDADIHQVSNLQSPGQDLITLHIYSPPLLRMDTYSLTSSGIGEFRPEILQYAYGSGI